MGHPIVGDTMYTTLNGGWPPLSLRTSESSDVWTLSAYMTLTRASDMCVTFCGGIDIKGFTMDSTDLAADAFERVMA